jgi:hypothetical protein
MVQSLHAQNQSCAPGHYQSQGRRWSRRKSNQKLRMRTVSRWEVLDHFLIAPKHSWAWVYQAGLSVGVESPCDTRSDVLSAESSEVVAEASPQGSSSTAGSHRPEHCRAHIFMTSFGLVSGILSKWQASKLLIPPERRSSCKESRDLHQHRCDHGWQHPSSSPEHTLQRWKSALSTASGRGGGWLAFNGLDTWRVSGGRCQL